MTNDNDGDVDEYLDAFVALGGEPDKEGCVSKDVLIEIIKVEFELTIDMVVSMGNARAFYTSLSCFSYKPSLIIICNVAFDFYRNISKESVAKPMRLTTTNSAFCWTQAQEETHRASAATYHRTKAPASCASATSSATWTASSESEGKKHQM